MRRARTALVLAVLLALAVVGATAAQAAGTTLYVDKGSSSCSDTGSGTSSQPFCSISKAATVATAGETVLVSSGTYSGPVTVMNSGTSSASIIFQTNSGAAVTVSGGGNGFALSGRSYVTIRGFTVAGTTGPGIFVASSNHITIDSNNVSGSGRPVSGSTAPGIKLSGTTASLVVGNVTHNNTDHGIVLTSASNSNEVRSNTSYSNARGYTRAGAGIFLTGSTGNTVDRNVSHDNEDTGISLWNGSNNSLVYDNVVYSNGDHGIDMLRSTGETVVANTVYRSYDSGVELQGSSSANLTNNVLVDNGINSTRTAGNIRVVAAGDAANSSFDYDLLYLSSGNDLIDWLGTKYSSLAAFQAATGKEPHGLQANPGFKAPGSGDFHLTAGSPAIDSANSGVNGQPSSDADGLSRVDDPSTPNTGVGPRSYDDRGAYEFQPSGSADNPPVARLSVTPSTGQSPLTVTADASASSDTDATPIATYTFDFGDGTVIGPQASSTATHQFPAAGTYSVTVTVKDTIGQSGSTSQSVTVTSSTADSAPLARLTVTPSSGTAPVAVTANASASSDTDATPIATYAFDFGDGTTVGPQATSTVSHTYGAAGDYTVTVTVTDTAGLASTATAPVTVSSPSTGGNLVGNPGFESGTTGWAPNGTGVSLARVSPGHDGSYAAQLSTTSTSTPCRLDDKPNWVASTQAGTYTGSLWVRGDVAGAVLTLRLREMSSTGSALLINTATVTLSTSWQQVTVSLTPTQPGTSSIDFNAYTSPTSTGMCFYADDASITLQ